MVDQINTDSKKRSLAYVHAQELSWKLKSKQDFIVYLDKHRKCRPSSRLTPPQYSSICPTRPSSTKTFSRMCSPARSS